ncbi:hypothetical protein L210DRAFT_3653223 [Boletus edulis BED1]|uniref:Uncharacterized protein n=1 Tax=Boletus edulis BED1 TaxID=1328754 RepID=A0AAD4BEQ8_BOLED|nr:hypothetical protein L210DRAFT_3653223 [Boletus edulis BED1]
MAGKCRKQPPTVQDPPQPPAPHTRRLTRVTAGQGGYTDQLERVAVAIETPCQPPRRKVNLPDDEPVNLMAPTPHRPRRKAPHRSGKGLKKKASAAPPSHPVPMVQAVMPVTTHATPDGRFGFQVPAPVPTFVGSQSIADFEQDRIAKKATRPMTSAERKTSGANAQAPGLDHPRMHGVRPPHSSGLRSNATAQSSRGTPEHQRKLTMLHPMVPPPPPCLKRMTRASNQLLYIISYGIYKKRRKGAKRYIEEDEEKEGDDLEEDELEEDNSEKDDEEKDSSEKDDEEKDDSEKDDEEEGKQGTSAVPVEEKDGRIPGNLFDDDVFTQAQELALADPDMYCDHDDAPARPQATQCDESTSQPFMRCSLPSKCQQADDCHSPTQSQQSSNTQLQRQSNARNNDHSSTSGRMNDSQHLPAHSRNPAQPRRPTQSHSPRVPSQSRPQVELQQRALLSPPPSRSNSIVGDPVAEAERSHRPGDEMIGVEYDLLKRHHSTNGRRRPPSPTYLDSVRSNGTGKYKKARRDPSVERSAPVDPQSLPQTNETTDEPAQDQPEGRKGKWSVNPKGTKPVKPTTLAFFPLLWVRLLDLAKARMRLYILVDDAFPPLATAIDGPCQECLLEAMAFNQESGNDELEDDEKWLGW